MKKNHIPQRERLRQRISGLELRQESFRRPARGSNPYWSCKGCGIYDPELSIQGRHYDKCPAQGLDLQIQHFKKLLAATDH